MTTRLPIDFLCFAVGEENDRRQLKSFKSPLFCKCVLKTINKGFYKVWQSHL